MFSALRGSLNLRPYANRVLTRNHKLLVICFLAIGHVDKRTFTHLRTSVLPQRPLTCVINEKHVRYKSRSKEKDLKKVLDDDEDSDDDDMLEYSTDESEDQDSVVEGGRRKTVMLKSLRVDQILKSGFNVTRRKAEELIWQHKIHLNGKCLKKKGIDVSLGDEMELLESSDSPAEVPAKIGKVIVEKIEVNTDSKMFTVTLIITK